MSTPKAIRNTLILKTLTPEAMTASGLHIPDMAQRNKDPRAEVVSIGPDCTAAVNVGEIVLYERGSADRMELDGVMYLRINENSLIGVIEPDTLAAAA